MSESCTSTDEIGDFALASQTYAATACAAVLARTREILSQPPSVAGLDEIALLAGMIQGIEDCIDAGTRAVTAGDLSTATLENARALVLMNALPLAADHPAEAAPADFASGNYQKSGMTG